MSFLDRLFGRVQSKAVDPAPSAPIEIALPGIRLAISKDSFARLSASGEGIVPAIHNGEAGFVIKLPRDISKGFVGMKNYYQFAGLPFPTDALVACGLKFDRKGGGSHPVHALLALSYRGDALFLDSLARQRRIFFDFYNEDTVYEFTKESPFVPQDLLPALEASRKHMNSISSAGRDPMRAKQEFNTTFGPVWDQTRDYVAAWNKVADRLKAAEPSEPKTQGRPPRPDYRDGDVVGCQKCGKQVKVKIQEKGKVAIVDPKAIQTLALRCQDCGFVVCYSCAADPSGAGMPTCPSCGEKGGPYFFTS